ncbi:MAG: CvpA family protein [Clostridia bacterium]|nr:CvpA family protein [Clostridia bacterium]
MNAIDIAVLVIIAVSVLFAVYRGFLASLMGLGAALLSLGGAFVLGPRAASWLAANTGLPSFLATYMDVSSLVGDSSLAATAVQNISGTALDAVMKSVDIPECMETLLRSNLLNASFASVGLTTVNEYISATIVSAALQIGGFVASFLACFIVLHAVISLIWHVLDLPVLRHGDAVIAAVFGLLRGMLVLYVLYLLLPLVRTAIPVDMLQRYITQSTLSPLFSSDGFFIRVVTGG